MKKVLIISYYFPPDGGAGTQRIAKFCKYLGEYGWQPFVITRDIESRTAYWPDDRTLLDDVGPDTEIERVSPSQQQYDWTFPISRTDPACCWVRPAYESAERIIQSNKIDAVLITMSPFALCYLGRRIQDALRIPVVYDLRDPWALDGWRAYKGRRHWLEDFQVMKRTLQTADGVIANTPEARKAILSSIPDVKISHICFITNGYDPEDFEKSKGVISEEGQFTLVHIGTLHTSTVHQYHGIVGALRRLRHYRPESIDPSGRTLIHLLKAINVLKTEHFPGIDRMRLVHVGTVDAATRKCVEESGLAESVTFTGYLDHTQSVAWLKRADAIFLPLHGLSPGQRSLIVPGKAYECLAARRPILACLPEGDAKDFVKECAQGFFAEPCDAQSIAEALKGILRFHQNKEAVESTAPSSLERFSRRRLTRTLASFLDQMVVEDSPLTNQN